MFFSLAFNLLMSGLQKLKEEVEIRPPEVICCVEARKHA